MPQGRINFWNTRKPERFQPSKVIDAQKSNALINAELFYWAFTCYFRQKRNNSSDEVTVPYGGKVQ